MHASTTMTIRISAAMKAKLDRLALDTRRSRSYLAGEAVGAYVTRELAIIDGIHRGLDDVEAGRVAAHDAAMDEVYGAIDAAAEARKA